MPIHLRRLTASLGLLAGGLLAAGCGGGGGGGNDKTTGGIDDPIIILNGPNGRLSRTITEANDGTAGAPPPFAPTVTTASHWFRLEFPFGIDPTTLMTNSVQTAPFSYLSGNLTVSDATGDHVPGLAMVNGVDVFGINHANDPGFPHDLQGTVDRNLGTNVFLYVTDVDRNLATTAAFGYGQIGNTRFELTTSDIDMVRVTLSSVNSRPINGTWTFAITATTDTRPPFVVSITSEVKDPTDPFNPLTADIQSSFVLEFSEPMVPKTVGQAASIFDASNAYVGNMPYTPFVPPLPPVGLKTTVNSIVGTMYIPFDCVPINGNNLATYRLRPLIDLPPLVSLDVLVRAFTPNTSATGATLAAADLLGNRFDGQDAGGDGLPDQVDHTATFQVGPGGGLVNIPVSPEVIYFVPSSDDGIGAIDLNGRGITTNTPGVHKNDRSKAILITKSWLNPGGCEVNPGGTNLANGISLWGHPGSQATPLDPCTGVPMIEYGHNRYYWPVGTGSYTYGPGDPIWEAPNDPGNPGTPFPGVNEGSSGFETLCRDSTGDVILTGRQFGRVGQIQDLAVGDFLDTVYFDFQNPLTSQFLHVTIFNSPPPHTRTGRGNTIADPPTPNPPPLRYWVGLPPVGIVLNQADLEAPALLLEGEEVFTGFKAAGTGYQQLQQNAVNPNAADQTLFPHVGVGPGQQSATQAFTFSARQQIGNFLYATDSTSREVHVINSNTMRVISSISLPDPVGLSVAPDMKRLYVSNLSQDTVSVVACDPLGANLHQEIARVQVGAGPKAIAVEQDNEDILVCNTLGNSISIIDTTTFTVRKTIDALIDSPYDIETTPRQLIPQSNTTIGWGCGVYFAYVSNYEGNSVVVYESGPDGPQGIGIDNVRGSLPSLDATEPILAPRGLCASPLPNPTGLFAGGCLVAHRDENGFGRVTHIQFTQQAQFGPLQIISPPGNQTPPGFLDRQFEITGSWGNDDSNRLAGFFPTDVCVSDMGTQGYQNRPSSAPNLAGLISTAPFPERTGFINSKHHMRLNSPSCFAAFTPDRIYVSFEDTDSISVLDPTQAGVVARTIPGGGTVGVRKLGSFFRQ